MKSIERVIPAASIAIFAVLAVLPWALPASARFVLPFFALIAIDYWSCRSQERLSAWVPFTAGLFIDVLTDGPLGFWSLIYLCAAMLGSSSQLVRVRDPWTRWPMFALTAGALSGAAWVVASLYNFALIDWRPFAWGGCSAGLAYPLLALVMRAIDPEPLRPSNDRLVRGA
jgi:rod shape-determining protein MreD